MKPSARGTPSARWSAGERTFFVPLATLVFGAGVWAANHTAAGLWPLWLIAVAAPLTGSLRLFKLPLRWGLLPLILMAALFWTQARLNPPAAQAGFCERIEATAIGEPAARSSGGVAVTVGDITLDGAAQPGRAYLTLDADTYAQAGELFDGAQLRFQGTVYVPSGKDNASDFDFRMWLLQDGVGCGISGASGLTVLNDAQSAPVKSVAARVRAFCRERFSQLMDGEGTLAMAMLLGDRDAVTQDEQLAFRRAGVAHLMAVSGLHVGLLAAALMGLMNLLSLRKYTRLAVMAAFLALYCVITGFSPASVRAAVMTMLLLFARAAGRKPDPLTTLSAAALIVLTINPLELFSAGFVLSFSAVAGILLLYPRVLRGLDRLLPERAVPRGAGRVRRFLLRASMEGKRLFAVSFAAQVGVLLPTAAYFHQLPLYGIAFNLLAVPLAGLLVPLYAVTLLCSLVPVVGWLPAVALGFAARWGSKLMLGIVELSNFLPYAQIRVPSPNLWACAGLLCGVPAVSGYVRARAGKRAVAVALVLALAAGGAYASRPAQVRYHQFAAGRADAALIVDGGATVAVDVGLYGSEVAGRLLAEGRSLDALILTHLHLDHAQGVTELLDDGIGIGHIYLPDGTDKVEMSAESRAVWTLLEETDIPIDYLAAGDTLSFGDVSIRVLWPEEGCTREGIDANDRSMATLIDLDGVRILSAADNGTLYEKYFALPCDILKVGHHGSATAAADAFLSVAQPTLAIVTGGAGTSAPSEETLGRLAAHGARVLNTEDTGEIVVSVTGDGAYRVTTYKTGENP